MNLFHAVRRHISSVINLLILALFFDLVFGKSRRFLIFQLKLLLGCGKSALGLKQGRTYYILAYRFSYFYMVYQQMLCVELFSIRTTFIKYPSSLFFFNLRAYLVPYTACILLILLFDFIVDYIFYIYIYIYIYLYIL